MGCASIECGCSRRAAAPRGGRQGRGRGGLGWMSELTGGRAQGCFPVMLTYFLSVLQVEPIVGRERRAENLFPCLF